MLIWQIELNSLASIWYSLLSAAVQAWLLFLGFQRYQLYTEMQWPTGAYPQWWLTVYGALLGACLPLLALFLVFGLLRLGNLAGDNQKLGARARRPIQLAKGGHGQNGVRQRRSFSYRLCHFLRSLWTHGPPAAQCVHVLLALLQLFAQQSMLAQLYRFGFINSGDFLNSELDFVFQRARQLATNLPMGETRLQSFRITSEELAASPLAPNLLPILMHARLFGIPLEFANLLLALAAFSITYPAVFWRANRAFSLLFSMFLFVHSLDLVWTYLGFGLLFRIQETNFYSPRPVGMGQHLWGLRTMPLYNPMALIANFWVVLILQQLAPIALYAFGYSKFLASQTRLRNSRHSRQQQCIGGSGDFLCEGLTSHVFAIVLLLVLATVKAPAFYALGLLYQKEERPFLLCCVLADLIYMFVWVLLWCALTCKCHWRFRVHYDVHELISLQDAHKLAEGSGANERQRCPAELKNALLLVHGDNLFLTDDPVAKPTIMRQVLRTCAPNHEDLPLWLRSAAQMAGGTSVSLPGTQSPQRRTLPRNGGHFMVGQRTPELGRRPQMALANNIGRESPAVPLAAPPYQRMASLPPLMFTEGQQQQQQAILPANAFGTLQSRPKNGNEYATFVGAQRQHHQQQQLQQQMACGGGTLTRSFNACQPTCQQQQQQLLTNPNIAPFCPESYATIQRRASKSSVASGFAAPPMASPHMLRTTRAASMAPTGAVNRNGHQQQMREQQTATQNGVMAAQMMTAAAMGSQQGFEELSGRDQQRLFDGLQQQNPQRARLPIVNGNGRTMEPLEQQNGKMQQQMQQQRQPQKQAAPNFNAAMNGGGVWQQELVEAMAGGGSLNGTTPTGTTGSLTVGSSRVGSAASNTSQATFEPVNGFISFGPPASDYGTLTREAAANGEMTLKAGQGQQQQWRKAKLVESEFATSVV